MSCSALPRYSGPSRPAAGTVITGQRIETTLDLSAGDIVVERSCIRPTRVGRGLPVITTTDYNNCAGNSCAVTPGPVTLRDCEIDGSAVDAASIAYSSAVMGIASVERCDIHHVGSGIALYNTGDRLDSVVRGNYIHDLRAFGDPAGAGSHTDGITVRDFRTDRVPDRSILIADNRVDCSSGNDTAAVFIQTAGDIDRVTLRGNLLEGDGYQLVLEARFGNEYGRSMQAVDNRFTGTGYGPTTINRGGLEYGWSVWQDNSVYSSGAPDARGRTVSTPR